MPTSGVEPPWGCPHLILSQARLPFRHVGTGNRDHRRAYFAQAYSAEGYEGRGATKAKGAESAGKSPISAPFRV